MKKQLPLEKRSVPFGLVAIYMLGFLLIALSLKNYFI